MSQNISLNGVTYTIPDVGDDAWGSNLNTYFIAIPQGVLQKTGGAFTLTNDVNFGATYGLISSYFKSRSASISTAGVLRLALADTIGFRNNANDGNLLLGVDGSDRLSFNGNSIFPGGITDLTGDVTATGPGSVAATIATNAVTNAKLRQSAGLSLLGRSANSTGDIDDIIAVTDHYVLFRNGSNLVFGLLTNANIDPAAAIAYSKLALTGAIVNADISGAAAISFSKMAALTNSKVVVTNGSGIIVVSSVSDTELGYLAGVTSAVQTQLDAKIAKSLLTTTGDILYASGANTPARLGVGASNQVLTTVGGLPSWQNISAGAKNYVQFNNFANNATAGWSLGTVSLTSGLPSGVPTFGSGASGNLAITTTSSGALAGSYSLQYASSAATTAGNLLASDALTLDLEDQAKVLAFKFYYSPTSNPTNANWSGTNSNSFGVAIYDVTNSAWIIPSGCFNLVQGSGVGIAQGTFQTPSNMTSFRIVFFNANATSGAITLLMDDFYVGPQSLAFGPPISDTGAQSWTPTISWGTTNVTVLGKWWRIGDRFRGAVEIQISGAVNPGVLNVNLPSGLTIDTSKLTSTNADANYCGIGGGIRQPNGRIPFLLRYLTSTSLSVVGSAGYADNAAFVTDANPSTWASGDKIGLEFDVPILGWSTSTIMSADSNTRVCAAKYAIAGAVSVSPTQPVNFATKIIDTHSAVTTGSSWKFTAPTTGTYRVASSLAFTAANTLYVYKQGVVDCILGTGSSSAYGGGSALVDLLAGQYIDIRGDASNTTQATTTQVISIDLLTGPATIAASDSLNARYATSAGQSIPNNTVTIIDFATKSYDSNGSVTTGAAWKFSPNAPGKFSVKAAILFATGGGWAAGEQVELYLYKGGVQVSALSSHTAQAAHTTYMSANGSDTISLLPGEYIDIRVLQNSGAALGLYPGAIYNYVAIERIP